ncbi:MAG TPA: SRPBCC family protein [Alphaproteobacteria bacterium]|nr:SRPBCC family protein [Alphaproteobacteria bacterium]
MNRCFHAGLPPGAYTDPAFLARERATLFRTFWQWAGLVDDLKKPGGLVTDIAGLPIAVTGDADDMRVSRDTGPGREDFPGAEAQRCGQFVFVRLAPGGPPLVDYLQDYAAVLQHCTDNFDEAYHVEAEEWACNWKAGLEITLEGYHVPFVHRKSEFVDAVPNSGRPVLHGPHSYQCGFMSAQTRLEMANVAKRLKIVRSELYEHYDHFTLFPNMTLGLSGGNLCFMQIYAPLAPGLTRLRYAYILARLADPASPPPAPIKAALLQKWRDFTVLVLNEDRSACERFQLGVPHAHAPALIGDMVEARVTHFHKFWRQAVLEQSAEQAGSAANACAA